MEWLAKDVIQSSFSLVGIDLLDVEMRKVEEEQESRVFLIEGEQNIPPYML